MSKAKKIVALRPSRILDLYLDFDGTAAQNDTLHLVASAGYRVQTQRKVSPPPRPWQEIVNAYLADYKIHAQTCHPSRSQRTTIREEIEWLSSLEPIEEASFQRALKAGIFNNVQESDVINAAKEALKIGHVKLRKGCAEFLCYIHEREKRKPEPSLPIKILSVNWSATFLHTIAKEELLKLGHITNFSQEINHMFQVRANELPSISTTESNQQTSSHIPIRTSGQKLAQFHSLSSTSTHPDTRTIYVGDSVTDFECLLAADTGICIRDREMGSSQQELAETCNRVGIQIRHISEKADLEKSLNELWWAVDFTEIQSWLQEIDRTETQTLQDESFANTRE